MRMLWRAASGQIVRRGNRDLTQVRTEFDGDHVLLDDFADADCGVIAARHDIHDLIVQREIEYDLGVCLMKESQERSQVQVRGRPEAMNANDAGRARASSLVCPTATPSSWSAGLTRWNSTSPAWVRETLRVFRCSRRIPTRSSSPRTIWLRAEEERRASGRLIIVSLWRLRRRRGVAEVGGGEKGSLCSSNDCLARLTRMLALDLNRSAPG